MPCYKFNVLCLTYDNDILQKIKVNTFIILHNEILIVVVCYYSRPRHHFLDHQKVESLYVKILQNFRSQNVWTLSFRTKLYYIRTKIQK